MNKNLLTKIKNTAITGSNYAVGKIEQGVKYTKIKLDLLAEEASLESKMTKLGEQCFQAMENASLDSLKEDSATAELTSSIVENQKRISMLSEQLSAIAEQAVEAPKINVEDSKSATSDHTSTAPEA
jgi:hypothetical protein